MITNRRRQGALMMLWSGLVLLVFGTLWIVNNDNAYLKAARLGGDYLTSHQHDDGSFDYQYNPVTGKKSSTYNILRHAGTTYSLLELYEATGNKKYINAAERALLYLENSTMVCPDMNDALCIEEKNEIKLGGNALAILALSKYISLTNSLNEQHHYLPLAQKLALFIINTQAQNGEFKKHLLKADTGEPTSFVSEYYPGEAIFALTRLYKIDGDTRWIESAHIGALWLIEVRDGEVSEDILNHDHWLLYGLNELYTHRPEEIYLSHAKKIVKSIVAKQHVNKKDDKKEWNGGFYNPPRSTPTATRAEGLGAAYWLFTNAGDTGQAHLALEAMRNAIEFQLRTQMTAHQAKKLGAHKDGIGGFFESLDSYNIRIDYVQHNISALLAFDLITKSKTK